MRVSQETTEGLIVEMTLDESRIISNALNEVVNGIEVPEFATRLGAERSEVDVLLKTLNDAYIRVVTDDREQDGAFLTRELVISCVAIHRDDMLSGVRLHFVNNGSRAIAIHTVGIRQFIAPPEPGARLRQVREASRGLALVLHPGGDLRVRIDISLMTAQDFDLDGDIFGFAIDNKDHDYDSQPGPLLG